MSFQIDVDTENPTITGAGAQYEGHRFRAECQIASRRFANPFGLDIAFGDPIFGEIETIPVSDILDFIDVPRPKTLAAVTDAARRFLDPVLSGDDARTWSPQDWTWSPIPPPA